MLCCVKRVSSFYSGANNEVVQFYDSYGCETWSLKVREEYIWRVYENRVLRRIFGPK
jgi:hypothetical protein